MSAWGIGYSSLRGPIGHSGGNGIGRGGHGQGHDSHGQGHGGHGPQGHDHHSHDGGHGLGLLKALLGHWGGLPDWKDRDCGDRGGDCDDKFTATDNEVVNGDGGDNEIRTGEGNQTVYGRGGNDTIAGGGGDDELSGGDGDDSIAGNDGEDVICGGDGNDLLLGNSGADEIYGGSGNDDLFGGSGNDLLEGGAGEDVLQGDKGNDVLTGGAGADSFVFRPGDGDDIVTDFDVRGSVQDSIDLSAFGAAFDTYGEIEAAMVEQGGDTLIALGNDQSILLQGVTPEDLSAGNFMV